MWKRRVQRGRREAGFEGTLDWNGFDKLFIRSFLFSLIFGCSCLARLHGIFLQVMYVVSNWNGLKERLKTLDPQGYATISVPEFQRLAERFHFRLNPKELQRLALSFDHHQTRNFHYIDFLRLFADNKKQPQQGGQSYHRNFHKITHHAAKGPEEMTVAGPFDKIGRKILGDWRSIRRAFKKADLNGDGHLSIPEFRRILANMKINIGEEDFYHIISEVDENMDGNISYDEFLAQLMPS